MRVVKSDFIELTHTTLYKKIEQAGRTCYKSENYITDSSAIDFTRRIMSYNHGSVLEHAYLVFEVLDQNTFDKILNLNNKFIKTSFISKRLISLNFRAFYNIYLKREKYPFLNSLFYLMANLYPEVLSYDQQEEEIFRLLPFSEVLTLNSQEKDLHLSISIRFICDRGVSHELVRHRLCSFAQESTRYCNYAKEKFSHEITFIETEGLNEVQRQIWIKAMKEAEKAYFALLENGARPEQARSVLPNSLKTEIVTTCTLDEWKIIFDLRCAPQAHPDIRILMNKVKDYFVEKGYLC